MTVRTVVQHEDRFIRSGLRQVLERLDDIEVVGEALSAPEALALCAGERPDSVLIDLTTTSWDGARLGASLRKRQRTLRVIGLHDGLDSIGAHRAHQAGIRTTVSHDSGVDGVIAAMRGTYVAASNRPSVLPLPTGRGQTLTGRERDVLALVAQGFMTKEIGVELEITVKTVENYKQRIFRKLDVQNQAHAVSVAFRRGLLRPTNMATRA